MSAPHTPPNPQSSSSSSSLLSILHATPDRTACTFAIRNEDHTLGNVLRHTLMQSESHIEFAGYSVPHPSEPIVQIRVQTRNHPTKQQQPRQQQLYTAPQALQEACDTVSKQCDFVLERLEQLLPYVQEDRIQMEQYYMEEQNDDDDEVIEEEAPDDNDDDDDDAMVEDIPE